MSGLTWGRNIGARTWRFELEIDESDLERARFSPLEREHLNNCVYEAGLTIAERLYILSLLADRIETAPDQEEDPKLSKGTCTDCKAQDGPCWCGDTLGCTC